MKKNSIKKVAALLALVETLALSGCSKAEDGTNVVSRYMDEDGIIHETIEIKPIVNYYQEPAIATRTFEEDGKTITEYFTTFKVVAIYTAPEEATRVEGEGSEMRCFIDRAYNGKVINSDHSCGLIFVPKRTQ